MNAGDTAMLLVRLPVATAASGQATQAYEMPLTVIGELANEAEAGRFAGILGVLGQAADTLSTSKAQQTPTQRLLADAPEALLELLREADIDLEAVAGPFSLVQLPLLNQADDAGPRSSLLSQSLAPLAAAAESRSQLLVVTEEAAGQTARALTHIRTLQGMETAAASAVAAGADQNGSTVLPPASATAAAGQTLQTAVPPSPTGADVPLRPGQAEWPTTFAARVVWLVEGGRERADLRLEPPHLGQLAVRVRLDGDQASLSFHSHNGMVREVVENALPRLRELMADAGYSLAEVDIGDGDARDGGAGMHSDDQGMGAETTGDTDTDGQSGEQTAIQSGDRLFDAYA